MCPLLLLQMWPLAVWGVVPCLGYAASSVMAAVQLSRGFALHTAPLNSHSADPPVHPAHVFSAWYVALPALACEVVLMVASAALALLSLFTCGEDGLPCGTKAFAGVLLYENFDAYSDSLGEEMRRSDEGSDFEFETSTVDPSEVLVEAGPPSTRQLSNAGLPAGASGDVLDDIAANSARQSMSAPSPPPHLNASAVGGHSGRGMSMSEQSGSGLRRPKKSTGGRTYSGAEASLQRPLLLDTDSGTQSASGPDMSPVVPLALAGTGASPSAAGGVDGYEAFVTHEVSCVRPVGAGRPVFDRYVRASLFLTANTAAILTFYRVCAHHCCCNMQEREDVLKGVVKSAKRRGVEEWRAGEIAAWLETGIGMPQYASRAFALLGEYQRPGAYFTGLDERGVIALVCTLALRTPHMRALLFLCCNRT